MLHPATSGNYAIGLSGTMKFQLYIDDSLVVRSSYRNRNDETPDPRVVQSAVRLEALRLDEQPVGGGGRKADYQGREVE